MTIDHTASTIAQHVREQMHTQMRTAPDLMVQAGQRLDALCREQEDGLRGQVPDHELAIAADLAAASAVLLDAEYDPPDDKAEARLVAAMVLIIAWASGHPDEARESVWRLTRFQGRPTNNSPGPSVILWATGTLDEDAEETPRGPHSEAGKTPQTTDGRDDDHRRWTPPNNPTRAVSKTYAAKHWFKMHPSVLRDGLSDGTILAQKLTDRKIHFDLDQVLSQGGDEAWKDADPNTAIAQ